MKFYDCTTAPSPRRVRVFAAEKGIELDTVQVDLGCGEQLGEEFRAINPDCVVPALVLDDGTCLSEASAICQYLEELKPEPVLWGSNATERALVTMWNAKIEQQGLWTMADAFRNASERLTGRAVPGPHAIEQIPELAQRGRELVGVFFEKLNRQLDGREYVAVDTYSIADITAMVVVDFAAWIKITVADDAVHLQRWYDAVSSRPSARA